MRIVKLIFCFVFVLFAACQYNDVDPYYWIPIYLFAAIICLLSSLNKASTFLILASMALYGIGFAYYVPSLVEWIGLGMPSITGTMKAESIFIELVREALGLLICFLVMGMIYLVQRRQIGKNSISKIPL